MILINKFTEQQTTFVEHKIKNASLTAVWYKKKTNVRLILRNSSRAHFFMKCLFQVEIS